MRVRSIARMAVERAVNSSGSCATTSEIWARGPSARHAWTIRAEEHTGPARSDLEAQAQARLRAINTPSVRFVIKSILNRFGVWLSVLVSFFSSPLTRELIVLPCTPESSSFCAGLHVSMSMSSLVLSWSSRRVLKLCACAFLLGRCFLRWSLGLLVRGLLRLIRLPRRSLHRVCFPRLRRCMRPSHRANRSRCRR